MYGNRHPFLRAPRVSLLIRSVVLITPVCRYAAKGNGNSKCAAINCWYCDTLYTPRNRYRTATRNYAVSRSRRFRMISCFSFFSITSISELPSISTPSGEGVLCPEIRTSLTFSFLSLLYTLYFGSTCSIIEQYRSLNNRCTSSYSYSLQIRSTRPP